MGIDNHLKVIKEGIFGRDVRQAIHDGIQQAYDDATANGNSNMEVAKARGTDATLGDRLQTIDSKISQATTGITRTEARIDGLIANVGNGTVPSELTDMRVASSGTLHKTAGASVREQFDSISIGHSPGIKFDKYIFTDGTVKDLAGMAYIETYIPVEDILEVNILAKPGAAVVAYYDAEKNFVGFDTGIINNEYYITTLRNIPNAKYVRFSIFNYGKDDYDSRVVTKPTGGLTKKLIDEIDLLREELGIRTINSSEYIKDKYIGTDGVIKTLSGISYIDEYFPINDIVEVKLWARSGAAVIAYYDAEKNFIGNDTGIGSEPILIDSVRTVPNAVYVRFTIFLPNDNTYPKIIRVKTGGIAAEIGKSSDTTLDKWAGKNVGFIGDSITAAAAGESLNFRDILARKYGFTKHVVAVSGAQTSQMLGQAQQLKSKNIHYDAIFIFGGTNDFNASVEIGEFFTLSNEIVNKNGQMVNLSKRDRVFNDTFCGRLNTLSQYLQANFPDTKLIYLTPLHRGSYTNGSNIQPDEKYANLKGRFIDEYVEAIKKAGLYWSIEVIDLHTMAGLYPSEPAHQKFFKDQGWDYLHPWDSGHIKIAEVIERYFFNM